MPQTAFASNIVPPTMLCIAEHESSVEQFTSTGQPLKSKTDDYGIFQIHESWIPTAKKMGLDVVNSPQDNIEFAIWLAQTHGYQQWSTYKDCSGSASG
jgi:hypothetical protein